ncbi:D-amino-acid transaminase [Rhodovulum sulfidophilum]|uniref:D-amino-acid transaminase n=1 Tax=Rhodovulum sulfidophilum TaxID=35806 RepID=UPI0019246CF3|nr:D-amino-acid transaminase [Rhodovulum sulfidophilum]MBL3573485.1 D-amino-acid transaminase [Rhodovulum sulfidophilum]MCE8432391.1 D-amino-acid transaminase [Rhodovulum sulfidophilum]MCF4117354.1 D-amino-acid transaminase [Rhodovulum sulfidophilum]
MTRTVYVNGDYLPETEARVSIFDRGFLFADGVYEVASVVGGKLLDFHAHAARLQRSLAELEMHSPVDMDALLQIHRELIAKNDVDQGMVYMQITRGAPADRDFHFPHPDQVAPSLVMFTQSKEIIESKTAETGIKVISIDDLRWARRDIKTVQLLYASMAKMAAEKAGADDAWMVEDGFVTEGSSNNAYIVKNGKIITRQLGTEILPGITRAAVLKFAAEAQMEIEERAFTIEEAKQADEAFFTSASAFVMPVVSVDGVSLGDGLPGPVSRRLREIYIDEAVKTAI